MAWHGSALWRSAVDRASRLAWLSCRHRPNCFGPAAGIRWALPELDRQPGRDRSGLGAQRCRSARMAAAPRSPAQACTSDRPRTPDIDRICRIARVARTHTHALLGIFRRSFDGATLTDSAVSSKQPNAEYKRLGRRHLSGHSVRRSHRCGRSRSPPCWPFRLYRLCRVKYAVGQSSAKVRSHQ